MPLSLSPQASFYASIAIYLGSFYTIDLLSTRLRVPHLHSEWLCWCFLLLASKFYRGATAVDTKAGPRSDQLALAIAAVCLFRTIGDCEWAIPLLTPLCLFLVSRGESDSNLPFDSVEKHDGCITRLTQSASAHSVTPRGLTVALVIAILSAASLLPTPLVSWNLFTGLSFICGWATVYFFISRKRADFSPDDVADPQPLPTQSTAWRVVAVLTMMSLVPTKENSEIQIAMVGTIAIAKATQWVTIMHLINQGYLMPLSTVATFAASTLQIFNPPPTSGRVELVAGVALVSLAQTYRLVHKFAHSRKIVSVVACMLLLGFTFRHHRPMRETWLGSLVPGKQLHPIEQLVKQANVEFIRMVEDQSKSLPDAVAEYQRRYNRPPPPGFDRWFDLAVKANTPIIDNYDTVMDTLEPFWGLSAKEIRARGKMIDEAPLANLHVKNHEVTITDDTLVLARFNEIIYEWLHRFKDVLPDMDFVVNGLAEPRVIVPNDRLDHLIHTCPPEVVDAETDANFTRKELEIMDLGKESSWQIGVRSCPEDSPSRSILIPQDQPGIPFVTNVTQSKDWCLQPKAAVSHGMFSSPFSLKVTDTLVPIFSHGKPSSSQDILYPSPDYVEGYRSGKYVEAEDPPWEEKANKLYWSGSDTGAFADEGNWRQFHRQRFVDMATNNEREVSLLQRGRSGRWESYTEKMANLSSLVDVHFSAMEACSQKACEDEAKALPFGDADERSVAWRSRFLFDVDGMGRTERYYRLLGSRSTVLKQTMHQEWHDDRLVPWVHFVPVSLGMEELPEMIRFLALTESGQKIGKNIADAGRDWQRRALREQDIELAFLRIMLEYGRLVSVERDLKGLCLEGRREED